MRSLTSFVQRQAGGVRHGAEVAGLAAKSDVRHNAQRGQQADAARGETLRARARPGRGKFQHQVRAAAQGGLGARELSQNGRVPALDEIAAHHAHDGSPSAPARAGYEIHARNETDYIHK